jgi:hypothetical protein
MHVLCTALQCTLHARSRQSNACNVGKVAWSRLAMWMDAQDVSACDGGNDVSLLESAPMPTLLLFLGVGA